MDAELQTGQEDSGNKPASDVSVPLSTIVQKEWHWTRIRRLAARMLATGEYTHEQVAHDCGCTVRSLNRWLLVPEFKDKIAELDAIRWRRILAHPLARKEGRIEQQIRRHEELSGITGARRQHYKGGAAALAPPESAAGDTAQLALSPGIAPGAESGWMTQETKGIGSGPNFKEVKEFKVDIPLAQEIRAIERSIAEELGQVNPKGEGSDTGGGLQISVTYIHSSDSDLSKSTITVSTSGTEPTMRAISEPTAHRIGQGDTESQGDVIDVSQGKD